jgi:ferrous iron transport protein B
VAVSILVWAALYYPHQPGATHDQQQRSSVLGRVGRAIEPAVRPLGWDWRIGCAVIASLPARETLVSTTAVMYYPGDSQTPDSHQGDEQLAKWLRGATWEGTHRPVFNVPVALSLMIFVALCLQCPATLAVIRRETNSWRWPAFTFVYMTVLAYVAALVTYQTGMWIGG